MGSSAVASSSASISSIKGPTFCDAKEDHSLHMIRAKRPEKKTRTKNKNQSIYKTGRQPLTVKITGAPSRKHAVGDYGLVAKRYVLFACSLE
jgi:hypothetical protein